MGERIRGRRGVELRRAKPAREPRCRICHQRGLTVASTVPNHIKPLAMGGEDIDSNIRCLAQLAMLT